MTLFSEIISTTRNDYLLAGGGEQRNKLTNTVDSSTNMFQLTYDVGNLGPGSKLSVGLEDVSVWDVNDSSKTVTVERGDYGSTASAHSAGDLVLVNPPVTSPAAIARAVNVELNTLSSRVNGLFKMSFVDLTYNTVLQGYDLPTTNFLSIWMVRMKAAGAEVDWPILSKWEHQPISQTTDFPSGRALFLREEAQPGFPIRVWYRQKFNPLVNLTDDVEAVSGLHVEAHDILELGAAWRMTAGTEVARNISTSQGDTRRSNEVPPGANLGDSRNLYALRRDRIKEEAARLQSLYPVRMAI